MARAKEYNEVEVIEKAMNLFWKNGFETTSMQMLEKEMGINKFSIYASFKNKNGVFVESIKCYIQKLNKLINSLKSPEKGVADIKQYFYDFIEFTKEEKEEFGKGCLIVNTINEPITYTDKRIKKILNEFTYDVKQVFANCLKHDKPSDDSTIERQADYLLIAMFGLSSATRAFTQSQLNNYIENTFKNI